MPWHGGGEGGDGEAAEAHDQQEVSQANGDPSSEGWEEEEEEEEEEEKEEGTRSSPITALANSFDVEGGEEDADLAEEEEGRARPYRPLTSSKAGRRVLTDLAGFYGISKDFPGDLLIARSRRMSQVRLLLGSVRVAQISLLRDLEYST
jgi:hypothetical protein